MRKILWVWLLFSCQQKSVPVITERRAALPRKEESVYPPFATAAPDTAAGNRLFAAGCGRCHGLPQPGDFTRERWDKILPWMFPRTRFSQEETFHVRAYVLAKVQE